MTFDINGAIESFSDAFGNRLESLREYCTKCSYKGSVEDLAEHIREIQRPIFRLIFERSEPNRLRLDEVKQMTCEYLAQNHADVNDAGVTAIQKWVLWMAWKEGCIKRDSETWSKNLF